MNALSSLTFSPLLPWSVLAVLAALSLSVCALALIRRARGAWLRLASAAAIALALTNPILHDEDRQSLPDMAVVMVDDSASQGLGERRAQTEQAVTQLRERLARLPNLEVKVEHVAPAEGGTKLFAALTQALADIPRERLAGIIAVTDGRVHDVPADHAATLGAPFHALVTGSPGERDRRLVITRTPSYALVGKSAEIALKVEDVGGSGEAALEVLVDGSPYLAASVPVNREITVEAPVRHGGLNVVEVSVAPGPAELSMANNRAALGISGVRDRLKVLLISGEPHAGERAWRNLLKSDPAVDLVHFTILRPPEKDDRTPIRELALITFPVRELFEDKLNDFDLVVFDRYRRRGVLSGAYYRNLADYVRRGGALLVAVGPEFAESGAMADTALGEVLPVRPTGQVINDSVLPLVTEEGRRHPVSSALPGTGDPPRWGPWLRQVMAERLRGNALLTGRNGQPLLVLDKVGEGRAAVLLSDAMWLWSRGYEGGGPHDEMLRRLAHWLMKEPELEEESLTAHMANGQLRAVRRSLSPHPETVSVIAPDGSRRETPLQDQGDGSALAFVPVDQPGLWRVEDGTRTAMAAIGALNPVEMAEITATTAVLAPVAEATGGSARFLSQGGMPDLRKTPSGGANAGRGWIGLNARDAHIVTGLRDVPLAPWGVLLVLAVGGMLAAWRRESGK